MKPRDVVVTMVIPDCTLPVWVLKSKWWRVYPPRDYSGHAINLTESPRVDPQPRKAEKRKPR